MQIQHADVPGFHGKGLSFGPQPAKINAKHDKQKALQGMSVVHSVLGLTQRAKQIASNKDHAEQQHAFVEPAGHATHQARCFKGDASGISRCVIHQSVVAVGVRDAGTAGGVGGWGSEAGTAAEAASGMLVAGTFLTGSRLILFGGTGLGDSAVLGGVG